VKDDALVDRLERDLLDDLQDDWVSMSAIIWSAQHVLRLTDHAQIETVVTETLARLVSHPDAKVVTGGMGHAFETPAEFVQHIAREWPRDGQLPVAGEVAWLVERDFELRQRSEDR
jgi:hypothetical protein